MKSNRKDSSSDSESEDSSNSSDSSSSNNSSSEDVRKRKKHKKHKRSNRKLHRHDAEKMDPDIAVKKEKITYISSDNDDAGHARNSKHGRHDDGKKPHGNAKDEHGFKSKWDSSSEELEKKR